MKKLKVCGPSHTQVQSPGMQISRYALTLVPVLIASLNRLSTQERRRQLAVEASEYKRLHFTLMQSVGDLTDAPDDGLDSEEARRSFSLAITDHLRRLYRQRTRRKARPALWLQLMVGRGRAHQAWHLIGIIFAHLARPADVDRASDLAIDLAHWKQVRRARTPLCKQARTLSKRAARARLGNVV